MNAHAPQDIHWGFDAPLPAQENHPAEVIAEIALYSYLNYSVDIHSWHEEMDTEWR